MDLTRSAVANWTQDPPAWVHPYIGIPYRQLDCWQLCARVALDYGLTFPDFADDLAHTADETLWTERLRGEVDRLVRQEREIWQRVTDPQALDVALFRVRDRWHVATVAGGGWALNTDGRRGAHAMRLRDSGWAHLLEGYYRSGSRRE